jgi:hypothetical protein
MSKPKILGTAVRRDEILIGDQVLELREPSIKATHEALEVVLDDGLLGALSRVAALFKEREAERAAELEVAAESDITPDVMKEVQRRAWVAFLTSHISDIVEIVKGAVIPVVSKKAGQIVAIALDTKKNREAMGIGSEALRDYVLSELTPSQALDALIALKDMIDWEQLGKKAQALLPKLVADLAPESPPPPAPVMETSASMS